MRKITMEASRAFWCGKKYKSGNTRTDGHALFLFGNKIAEWRYGGVLWISTAGWKSNTTKERLNGLPGVSISQKKGIWYLNGEAWEGEWRAVGTIREEEIY